MRQANLFGPLAKRPRRDATIQLIKYMGSKREIVDFVASTIDNALCGHEGCTVLDLFSGTSSVGYALGSKHRIIANDIQHYSQAIAKALLTVRGKLVDAQAIWKFLSPHVERNKTALLKIVGQHVARERELLSTGQHDLCFIAEYMKFSDEYPHAGALKHTHTYNGLCRVYSELLKLRREDSSALPYCLFTTYFANAYFGLEQSIEFDSLRFAIDAAFGDDSDARWVGLACLMHAASYCTPGPGHFAQFRAINSPVVCEDILRYRNRSPREYFLAKWEEFRLGYRSPIHENICVRKDYKKALSKYLPQSDLVYADPPYSFVHYSRFYHALETLVLYDYPSCEFYGRYRDDRHQSPFCIRTKVKRAFLDIIEPVAAAGKKLVISYSNTGMIDLATLQRECKRFFGKKNVRVGASDYLHATMGRRGDKHREVQEILIVCGG